MIIEEAQDLIEKCIFAGKQLLINYTNSKGETKNYKTLRITSTTDKSFKGIFAPALDLKQTSEDVTFGPQDHLLARIRDYLLETFNIIRRPNQSLAPVQDEEQKGGFKTLNYERINTIHMIDDVIEVHDQVLDKIRNNSLFAPEDDAIIRKGGIKGYPSSINTISNAPQKITKLQAQELIEEIDIPVIEGWERAVMLNITDGDTFEILLEADPKSSYDTRLFGVDAPELKEESEDYIFALEAKVFVEKLFAASRYCYVKDKGKDTFKRELKEITNHNNKDVSICLLENGLGIPMMGYLDDAETQKSYVEATKNAYDNRRGVWALEEIYRRYDNIMSDKHQTKIDLMQYIHNKKSAFSRYLNQSPSAKIIKTAVAGKKENLKAKKKAKEIFKLITKNVAPATKEIKYLKQMCDLYLEEIQEFEKTSTSKQAVRDCIMHIEDLLDELNLGVGNIKGNFSKGKEKLIYHDDPDARWYKLCIPEIRFKTVEDATYCGFKRASG